VKIIDCEQGSLEWRKARAGLVTASMVSSVTAKKDSAKRNDYLFQIVSEILTGEPIEEGFVSKHMEWGTAHEPFARGAYEVRTGVTTERVGFCAHDTLRSGASPDGFVGKHGLVEIKCPKTGTHVKYLIDNKPPTQYLDQMHWQMAVTGRKWCDFVSFDPRLDDDNQLFIVRLNRDEEYINYLTKEIIDFLDEVDSTIKKLKSRRSK
jgi:putative phage-type endonuclease